MENIIEIKKTPVRNFVDRHKTAITIVATSTVWYALNRISVRQHDEFLKEHDLYDAFYTPTDEEMGL